MGRSAMVETRLVDRPLGGDAFVGREQELAELASALTRPGAVVSVYGQSGIGKSRLLAEAERLLTDPTERPAVIHIDCVDMRGLDETLCRLVEGTGVRRPEGRSTWADDLRGRDLVLVLDHADHVRGVLPDLLSSLAAQDGPRCVVASVLPLPQGATTLIGLEPLAVPPVDGAHAAATSYETTDAMDLFIARVVAASPDFVVDDETRSLVASVVGRLGGVPLAIELAAARHALLGLPELARLTAAADRGLGALGRRSDDRRSSMAAALAWTIRQLEPEHRDLLGALTVFAGDAGTSAIADIHGGELSAVLDALSSLVDLRLVEPRPDPAGALRFELRPQVAQPASTHLAPADERALRAHHARYYSGVAARGARQMLDAREHELDPSLALDLPEVHRAVEWFEEQGDIAAALTCAADLTCLLAPRAGVHRTRRLLRSLLAASEGVDGSVVARARIAAAASELTAASSSDESRCAMDLWKQGYGVVTGRDPSLALWAHSIRVRALPVTGDFAGAASSAQAGLALAESIGHPVWQARFEVWAGMVHHQLRDFPSAVKLGESALRRSLATGDRFAQIRVGMLLHQIPASEWAGSPLLPSLEALLDHTEALGDLDVQGWLLANLVSTALRDGELVAAGRWLRRLLAMSTPARGREAATALMATAVWASAHGELREVARFYGAIKPWEELVIAGTAPAAADDYLQRVAAAQRALGRAEFDAHTAEGAHGTVDTNLRRARELIQQRVRADGADRDRSHPPSVELTPREVQVLGLLADGLRNKEIAARLGTSAKTVMHHTCAIYRKLGVRGRAEAVAMAVRDGIGGPRD
jgi:DNA-binding CsgD family transcriptional regulator/predicted ATPase